ncbi:U1 small nuclear ribonucleoprotein [Babesia ovis]|uniref:U1 small nuclear ribonucleoprotein n=1 Tax=Babesia ovis TaxID=5869 RepID=A0A9W5TBJ9_BABOV|nr:U1 small nuclear ribonucleoprotein [Babesia ovis]
MTDYWVSTKKHYCEICRCWITGSATNIKNHESSARHISELRKKLVESHRKQVAQKEQDDFEAAEIARLNSVTMDGPLLSESTSISAVVPTSMLTNNRILNAPVDKQKEQERLKAAIERALAGQPIDDPGPAQKSRWMAFIDQEDGTLTYYNNESGLKTKTRPRDFDGTLPTASSSLTSNWTLKYDPSKNAKYYQNVHTGEIRWLDHAPSRPATTKKHVDIAPSVPIKMEEPSADTKSKPKSQIKVKLDPCDPGPPVSTLATPVVKQEPEEPTASDGVYATSYQQNDADHHTSGNNDEEQSKTPMQYAPPEIGQWEVVKPEESAFSHSIVSLEPYLEPPPQPVREPDIFDVVRDATYETPLLNVDDMQLQEKQIYLKHKHTDVNDPEATPVTFAKRKLPKKK